MKRLKTGLFLIFAASIISMGFTGHALAKEKTPRRYASPSDMTKPAHANIYDNGTFTAIPESVSPADPPYASASDALPQYPASPSDLLTNDEITTFANDGTFGFTLRKVSDEGILRDAVFRLYRSMDDATYNEDPLEFTLDETKTTYTACPSAGCPQNGTKTYDIIAGVANIDGLMPGTYYLAEILAPVGYQRLYNPYQIIITDEGVVYTREMLSGDIFPEEAAGGLLSIWNHKAVQILPGSGGIGTGSFYVIGSGFILAALFMAYHMKKRR